MTDLNTFFDTATPAQINQLTAQAPKQNRQPEPAAQIHPNIAPPTLDELPEAPMEEVQVQADQPIVQIQEEVHEPIQQPEPQEPVESSAQRNWREVREQKLRAEWERDELARRLQAYESAERGRASQLQKVEEAEEDLGIAADDVIEGKHIAKIIKQVERRTEQKMRVQNEAMMQVMVENRLKMELPDLDAIVNPDSIAKLRSQYPELAQSINSNTDLYTKAKAAYTMIKQLSLDGQPKPQPNPIDRQRIATNAAKPRSAQAVGVRQSPLVSSGSYDGELTDELKAQLRKEMEMARRR